MFPVSYYLRESEKAASSYGVTYEEYWYGDTNIVQYKYNAVVANAEYQFNMLDTLGWVTGKYVRTAIVSAFNKQAKFPQKPDGIKKKPKTQEEQAIQTFNTLERWRKSIVSKNSAATKK